MFQFTSRSLKRGVRKAVAAFFAVATLISLSSATVRAGEATIPSAGPFAQPFLGGSAVGYLPLAGPLFGFPVSLNNLTWGNYSDSDSTGGSGSDYASMSNLTWGNYKEEPTPEPGPDAP